METHTQSSQRRPHRVLLIDLENFGTRNEKGAAHLLDSLLSATGYVDRVYAATACPTTLQIYRTLCADRNVRLMRAPQGKDAADLALLNAARSWERKPDGAVFYVASCDHIFASLPVVSVITQTGRAVAKKLQKKSAAIRWLSLSRQGKLLDVETQILNPAKFRRFRKALHQPQLELALV